MYNFYPIDIFYFLSNRSPFNPSYTAFEISNQINQIKAKAVVTLPPFLPNIDKARKTSPSVKYVITIGDPQKGCLNYFDLVKTDWKGTKFLKGKDVNLKTRTAIIPWSSGTTGE